MEPTTNETIRQIEDQYTSGVYTKRPVAIVRGLDAHLWDADGKEYIDCVGGQGAANLGHANPAVAQAIAAQAHAPDFLPGDVLQRPPRRPGSKLMQPDRHERASSCAIRAPKRSKPRSSLPACSPGAPRVVATMRGFHGRTMGALSATWEKKYREPFEPLVPGFSPRPL